MQSKRKKFWIGFSVAIASIVVLFAVLGLLTRLKTVNVEFVSRLPRGETMLEEGIMDKVSESGNFDYGKNLLFMNFDDEIKKIEKENPYVKVHQIRRFFPNKIRVTISERVPRFRIQDKTENTKWYILDSDFKVLDVVTGNLKEATYGTSNFYDKTVEITPDSLTLSSFIGEFVNDEAERSNLVNIMSGVYAYASDYFIVKSIKIEKSSEFVFSLTMKNTASSNDEGCKIKIYGNSDLVEMVRRGIATYHNKLENDEYEDITKCEIKVQKINGQYRVTSTGFRSNEV